MAGPFGLGQGSQARLRQGMSPHAICARPMLTSRPGPGPVLGTSFCLGA